MALRNDFLPISLEQIDEIWPIWPIDIDDC